MPYKASAEESAESSCGAYEDPKAPKEDDPARQHHNFLPSMIASADDENSPPSHYSLDDKQW